MRIRQTKEEKRLKQTAYVRAWRVKNKEKHAEYRKKWNDKNRDKVRLYVKKSAKKWRDNNKGKIKELRRKYNLRKKYGLSQAKYDLMLQDQGNVCAICKNLTNKKLFVDHDHSSGAVRGLLCATCNAGIGYLRDSPDLLESAINYLKNTKIQ